MKKILTNVYRLWMTCGLLLIQACSHHSTDLPTPATTQAAADLSVSEAYTWFQQTYPLAAEAPADKLKKTKSSAQMARLVWARAITVGAGAQSLVLVPLAGDNALFARTSWHGPRYLLVTKQGHRAIAGNIVEVLLRRGNQPMDTLALFTQLYRSYRKGQLVAPAQGEGYVFFYSADYRYLSGRPFQQGRLLPKTARLAFRPHGSRSAKSPASGARTNFEAPDSGPCLDWYNADSGEYITTTGDCSGPGEDDGGSGGYSYGGGGGDSGGYGDGDSGAGPGGHGGGGGVTSSPGPNQTNTIINNLPPCLDQVYNSLKGAIDLYSTQMAANGSNSTFLPISYFSNQTNNWQIGSGSLPSSNTGSTISDYSDHIIKTTFDDQQLKDATDLSIMKTMLHESVHAYLVAYFVNDRTKFGSDYPDLLESFDNRSPSGQNNAQHTQMVISFKNDIADILFVYSKQLGYDVDLQYCQDLAWSGLERTAAYQNLSQQEKNRIFSAANREFTGINAKGTKTTGC